MKTTCGAPPLRAGYSSGRFVLHTLRPHIELERRELVKRHGERWADKLQLTLSLGSGTPARVAAINAGLRQFRPTWLHIWQPKRFWHEFPQMAPISDEDIDYHSYFDTELLPATPAELCEPQVQLLIEQMAAHRDRFTAVWASEHSSELRSFWIRKTKQPVLSVLMTQQQGRPPDFHFGVNMEVSMPTGSLCAERNAIGNALAADASLQRRHFCMVAVLCIPDYAALQSTAMVQSESKPLDGMSQLLLPSCAADFDRPPTESAEPTQPGSPTGELVKRSPRSPTLREIKPAPEDKGQSVIKVRWKDKNPLSPCGACSEWLQKLSEVNPDFKVITFTSIDCSHAYVKTFV